MQTIEGNSNFFAACVTLDEAHRKSHNAWVGEVTKANKIEQDFKAGGMEFVLTEHFCQDPVEECFRKQRQLGRSDNPEIHHFGDNSNSSRIERSISSSRLSSRVGSFELKHE